MSSALVLCINNQVFLSVMALMLYLAFFFTYLMKNHSILLVIQKRDQVKKIAGNRYSFRHPLKIYIKKGLAGVAAER